MNEISVLYALRPKGAISEAKGIALCSQVGRLVSPKVGCLICLIPQISFIIFNIILIQKFSEFLLKIHLLMMFSLIFDKQSHTVNSSRIDRENSISILPVKI